VIPPDDRQCPTHGDLRSTHCSDCIRLATDEHGDRTVACTKCGAVILVAAAYAEEQLGASGWAASEDGYTCATCRPPGEEEVGFIWPQSVQTDHCSSCCWYGPPIEEDKCPECGAVGTITRAIGYHPEFGDHPPRAAIDLADMEPRDIVRELERIREGRFTPDEVHEFCHSLGDTVTAEAFANGCAAYQRSLYGRAPSEDHVNQLMKRVEELEAIAMPDYALVLASDSAAEAIGKRVAHHLAQIMDRPVKLETKGLEELIVSCMKRERGKTPRKGGGN
jgi:hypothetical protein